MEAAVEVQAIYCEDIELVPLTCILTKRYGVFCTPEKHGGVILLVNPV